MNEDTCAGIRELNIEYAYRIAQHICIPTTDGALMRFISECGIKMRIREEIESCVEDGTFDFKYGSEIDSLNDSINLAIVVNSAYDYFSIGYNFQEAVERAVSDFVRGGSDT